jgi:hypothetical protein
MTFEGGLLKETENQTAQAAFLCWLSPGGGEDSEVGLRGRRQRRPPVSAKS